MIESNWKYIAQRSGLSSSKLYLMKNTTYNNKHVAKNHIFYINRKDECDEWTISKAPSGY